MSRDLSSCQVNEQIRRASFLKGRLMAHKRTCALLSEVWSACDSLSSARLVIPNLSQVLKYRECPLATVLETAALTCRNSEQMKLISRQQHKLYFRVLPRHDRAFTDTRSFVRASSDDPLSSAGRACSL